MPQILKQEIKERILASALDSFLENGYRDTSMQQIAQKAGIAAGNIYNYFKSKELIFSTLADPVLQEVKAIFKPFAGGLPTINPKSGMDIAEKRMNAFIKVYQKNRKVFVLLFEKSDATRFETTRADVIQTMASAVIRLKNALTPIPATLEQEVLVKAYVTAYINGIISILTEAIDEQLKLDALQKFLPFMRSKLVENLR